MFQDSVRHGQGLHRASGLDPRGTGTPHRTLEPGASRQATFRHRRGAAVSEERGVERATEVREHLANERTLLSWVRTGVGLISLGIVVERAGAFMSASDGRGEMLSGLFGLALALLGSLTLALGTVQFLRNRRRISRGEFVPQAAIYLVVVGGGLTLGGCFAAYVLYTLMAGS